MYFINLLKLCQKIVKKFEHKKTMTFADGNPGPDLRKVQKHIHLIIFTKLFCH
jgi:hypothetical protein